MRIVHYTWPCYLDHSLSLVRAVSREAEVHLMLELSPESRASGMFGEQALKVPAGVCSAKTALQRGFLAEVATFLDNLASFSLVVHFDRRAFAPLSLRTGYAAAAHVRRLRPDVLHIEEAGSRVIPMFFFTPAVPKLLAIHDATPHPGEPLGRRDLFRRLAVKRSRHLLFYSRFSRDQFTRTSPSRQTVPAAVVPLGVKEVFREWPGPETSERPPTLLFFGRIAQYKGLEVLYRALPKVAAHVPGLRVIVAGRPTPGYDAPSVPPLPGVVEVLTCFGTVDNVSTRRLFSEASVVVVPYIEASQSGVVQTAYAFGKPVVASAIGGLREAVRDGLTGRLVPPADPDALAQALIEVLTNPAARAAMRRAIADCEAAEFGWDAITQQLKAIYWETSHATAGSRHRDRQLWDEQYE